NRERERLLAIDVLAGPHGGDGDGGMPVVRRADGDGVDVAVAEQLAVVGEDLAITVVVARVDDVGGKFGIGPVHVAHGNHAHAVLAHGVVHDADAALAVQLLILPAAGGGRAGADGRHGDAVVRPDPPRLGLFFLLVGDDLLGVPDRQSGRNQTAQRPR